MGSEQLDQKLKTSHLGLSRAPLAFGLDGTSSDVTFRQARKLSAAKGGGLQVVQSRIDHMVVRQGAQVDDLSIDNTFTSSDHFPLVGAVGAAAPPEAILTPSFKVDRSALRKLTAGQMLKMSNRFAALDVDESDTDSGGGEGVAGGERDWDPDFETCDLPDKQGAVDDMCAKLFETTKGALLEVGAAKLSDGSEPPPRGGGGEEGSCQAPRQGAQGKDSAQASGG